MQDEPISHPSLLKEANEKDSVLWTVARRRAAFKVSAATYVIVNLMLIAIWYLTSGPGSYFWPVWSMLGWGVGIATQYLKTYQGISFFSTQREYEKLKRQQQN